jgi:hypothetical protein
VVLRRIHSRLPIGTESRISSHVPGEHLAKIFDRSDQVLWYPAINVSKLRTVVASPSQRTHKSGFASYCSADAY